jgi:hypothetical protein
MNITRKQEKKYYAIRKLHNDGYTINNACKEVGICRNTYYCYQQKILVKEALGKKIPSTTGKLNIPISDIQHSAKIHSVKSSSGSKTSKPKVSSSLFTMPSSKINSIPTKRREIEKMSVELLREDGTSLEKSRSKHNKKPTQIEESDQAMEIAMEAAIKNLTRKKSY